MLKLWWRMCGCCLFAKVDYLWLIGDMIISCVLYTIRDIDNDLMSWQPRLLATWLPRLGLK